MNIVKVLLTMRAEKHFLSSSDDELKFLLYGIEQRFYTTMFGQEKRLANSIQTIG
jgi:hypothetical protein